MGTLNPAMPPAPAVVDLRNVPDTPVAFTPIDLLTGMNYSYGFAVQDFDCDRRPDVSFFDSSSKPEGRPAAIVIGYVSWNGGPLEKVVEADDYPELPRPELSPALFERHLSIDVNNDSLPDIVGVVNSHASVVAYINPGFRNMAWQRRYLSVAAPGAINLDAGDIDGDGDADLVVAMREQPSTDSNPVKRGVIWLKNPGKAGEAWEQRPITPSDDLLDPRTVRVADINGDRKLDVVVSDASTGTLSMFKGDGGGTWERRDVNLRALHGHFGMTSDLDRDGKSEILQPIFQGIALLRNSGTNADGGDQWDQLPVASFAQEEKQIVISETAFGDIDLDGLTDIVFVVSSLSNSTTEPRRGGIYWLRQTPDGWKTFRIANGTDSIVGVSLVDRDRDGDLDIVSNAEYLSQGVTVWTNKLR